MSKNSNRSNGGGRNDFPIFAAILLGIVMGLALAAVIAWFVLKKTPPTVPPSREPIAASKPVITPEKPATKPDAHTATSTPADNKTPRFEFYKELTGKPDSTTRNRPAQQEAAQQAKPNKPAEASGNFYLQEGAYTNMDDAEKIKAKLALLGLIASIQPAQIPDKGLWYRVRLGPYKSTTERDEALATLKLNGLNAAPIKVQ